MKIITKNNIQFTHEQILNKSLPKNFNLIEGQEKIVYIDAEIKVDSFKFETQKQALCYLNERTTKYTDKLKRMARTHHAQIIVPLEKYKLDILINDSEILLAGDTENCRKKEYTINEHSSNVAIQNVEMFTYLCGFTFYRSGEHFYFTNIAKYIDFIEKLPFLNIKVFYHNLSYDSAFHMHDLLKKYRQEFTETEIVRQQRRVISQKNKAIKYERKREEIKHVKSDFQVDLPHTMKIAESEMTKYFINTNRDLFLAIKKTKINVNIAPSDINWDEIEVSEHKIQQITYADFYKIIPQPLENIGKMIQVPPFLNKGENYDYKKIRKEGELEDSDFDYFFRDLYILDRAMVWADKFRIQNKSKKSMLEHITQAEFALKYWESGLKNKYKYYSLDRKILITEDELIPGEKVKEFRVFQSNPYEKVPNSKTMFLLPIVEPSIDDDIRKSYSGGYVYTNPKYKGVRHSTTDGNHIALSVDRTSMYPSEMVSNPMPIGLPKWHDNTKNWKYEKFATNKKEHKLRTFCVLIDHMNLKRQTPGNINIPTVMPKGFTNFEANKYITHNIDKKGNKSLIRLFLNETDFVHMLRNYTVHYEIMGYYEFDVCYNLFDEYILHFAHMKQHAKTKSERDFSKLMLNSLYGKYATRTDKKDFEYVIENGVAKKKEKQKYKDLPIYTAISSWITTYSRNSLFNLIYTAGDKFYYCDTDSVHSHMTMQDLKEKTKHLKCNTRYINNDRELVECEKPLIDFLNESYLCGWKVEQLITDFKALKAKSYIEYGYKYEDAVKNCFMYNSMEKELVVKCAGLKRNVLTNISNLPVDSAMNVFSYCDIDNFDKDNYNSDSDGFIYSEDKKVPGIFLVEKVFNCRNGKTFVPRFSSIFE